MRYSLGYLWNTASVCWLWRNTSQKIPPQWYWSLPNHSWFFSPRWPEPQIFNLKYHINSLIESLLSSKASQIRSSSFLHSSQHSCLPSSHNSSVSSEQPMAFLAPSSNTSTDPPPNTWSCLSQWNTHEPVTYFWLSLGFYCAENIKNLVLALRKPRMFSARKSENGIWE